MADTDLLPTSILKYAFAVDIDRPAEAVWDVMVSRINEWWMQDYRALGEGSSMSLSAVAGGSLLETLPNGTCLEWYRVQMNVPGAALYLVGYMAPDWGGPSTSMLKLEMEAIDETSSRLKVSDAIMGNVTKKSAGQAETGWKEIFGMGLKGVAEE